MIRPLHDPSELLAAARAGAAVLYKHSPACWISARALKEVRAFAEAHPGTPVFMVDVLAQRTLSQALAARLGVTHRSPQAILLDHGEPVWDTSQRLGGANSAWHDELTWMRTNTPPEPLE